MRIFGNIDPPYKVSCEPDTQVTIKGWAIDHDNVIDHMRVQIQGKEHVVCRYGLQRPDLAEAYRHIPNALYSGFVATLPAPEKKGAREIVVSAVLRDGQDIEITRKTIHFGHADESALNIFRNCLAGFGYDKDFDVDRLVNFPEEQLTVLLGEDDKAIASTSSALEKVIAADELPGVDHFDLLRNLLVTTKNSWDKETQVFFSHLGEHLNAFGIGHVDIYAIMNAIVKSFESSRTGTGDLRFAVLPGERGIELVPFLNILYPSAQFIYFRSNKVQNAALEERGHCPCIWETTRKSIESSKLLELDGDMLQRNPEAFSSALAEFIKITGAGEKRKFCETLRELSESVAGESILPKAGSAYLETPFFAGNSAKLQIEKLLRFPEEQPIFILGAGRSGTSAIVAALKAGTGLTGWHEGHIFPFVRVLLQNLIDCWQKYAVRSSREYSEHYMAHNYTEAMVYNVLNGVLQEIVPRSKGDSSANRWLSKTPDARMIQCVPLLTHLFPEGRYIYMRRHPVSVALSRVKKFGETPLVAATEWRKAIETWEDVRTFLPPCQFREFDQRELTQNTLQVIETLKELLCFGDGEYQKTVNYLLGQRPEFTGNIPSHLLDNIEDGSRQHRRLVLFYGFLDFEEKYLEDTAWAESEQSRFRELCGEKAEKYGYRLHRVPEIRQDFIAKVAAQMETLQYTAEEKIKALRDISERLENVKGEMENWKCAARQGMKDIEYLTGKMEMYRVLYEKRTLAYWIIKLKAMVNRRGPRQS